MNEKRYCEDEQNERLRQIIRAMSDEERKIVKDELRKIEMGR